MSRVKKNGFTLIELVSVIVILGVLATATTQYIIFGTEIYVQGNERQQVLTQSRFLIERLTRELRAAIPNSVRVDASNACLEFVPIKTSGAYRTNVGAATPPVAPNAASTTLDVVSWDAQNSDENDRLYIYATSSPEVYDGTNQLNDKFSRIFSVAETSANSAPRYTITFKRDASDTAPSPDRFATGSPITRYFTADRSVNYCFVANGELYDVYRFENFNYGPGQTVINSPSGVLMAEGLTNNLAVNPPFEFVDAALTRNSIVNLYLQFRANVTENMFYNHEVHIPNVP